MTSKVPAIPSTDGLPAEIKQIIDPLKEAVERLSGQRPKMTNLGRLGVNATQAQIVSLINSIAERLEGQ